MEEERSTQMRIQDALRRDDREALDMMWAQYGEELLTFLVARLGSRSDGEDALQTLFVRIARKHRRLLGARNLRAYLFSMARHVAVDAVRRTAREVPVEDADMGLIAVDAADPTASVRARELSDALASLPAEQREVVVLKAFRDMTFREIGELLALSPNTAASRYRYGLAGLRRLLKDDHDV